MSKTISLPVIPQEVTENTKRLPAIRPVKDPVSFPEHCVYCGAPKSEDISFFVTTKIPNQGEASALGGKFEVIAPFCDEHARQSKSFGRLMNRFMLGAFILIGLPLGLASFIEFLQRINFFWGLAAGVSGAVVPVVFAMIAGKSVLGFFIPAIKDYKIGSGELGISAVFAQPKAKADIRTHTLDFTFTNEEYASMFRELNRLSPEEIATLPAQLEAAERARAAKAKKMAAEAEKKQAEAKVARREARIEIIRDVKQKIDDRRNAANALGELGETSSIEPLIEALGDRDSALSGLAARSLGKIGDARAVEPLVDILHTKGKGILFAFPREEAAKALALIGGTRAFEALIESIRDKDAIYRLAAAKGLGEINNERVLEPLTLALEDENPSVRKAAKEALKKIRTRTA